MLKHQQEQRTLTESTESLLLLVSLQRSPLRVVLGCLCLRALNRWNRAPRTSLSHLNLPFIRERRSQQHLQRL